MTVELSLDGRHLRTRDAVTGATLLTFWYEEWQLVSTTFTNDPLGRLLTDADAEGGVQTLTGTNLTDGWRTSLTNALGEALEYRMVRDAEGGTRTSTTLPDGSVSISSVGADATQETLSADGTRTRVQFAPDPRLGMTAPFAKVTTVQTPRGLTSTAVATRAVTLGSWILDLQTSTDRTTNTITSLSPTGRQTGDDGPSGSHVRHAH